MARNVDALNDELLEDIFSRLRRPRLWAPSPVEQVCRRWRRVFATSPLVWSSIQGTWVEVVLAWIPLNVTLKRYKDPEAATAALDVALATMARRAPCLQRCQVDEGGLSDVTEDMYDSMKGVLQRVMVGAEEILRRCLAAAPLQSLALSHCGPGALELASRFFVPTLTELVWNDGKGFPNQRFKRTEWPADGGQHLARLTGLQALRVAVPGGDMPEGLAQGIAQLSTLRTLFISLHPGECRQQGQQQAGVQGAAGAAGAAAGATPHAVDLGFLWASAPALRELSLISSDEGDGNDIGGGAVHLHLLESVARRLTALTLLKVGAKHSPSLGGMQYLHSLRQLELVGVQDEGGEVWHCPAIRIRLEGLERLQGPSVGGGVEPPESTVYTLCVLRCGIPPSGFPASICQACTRLAQLDLTDCRLGQHPLGPGVLPGELAQLPLLVELSLEGNGLRQLPTVVPKLRRLMRLNLDGNELASLPSQLSALRELYMLQLSGNKLTQWPSVLYELRGVMVLDLSYNPLRPTHLDIDKLLSCQCFARGGSSPGGESWLFMGDDEISWAFDKGKMWWTGEEAMAGIEFAKAFPACSLRLGDSARQYRITLTWSKHFNSWLEYLAARPEELLSRLAGQKSQRRGPV